MVGLSKIENGRNRFRQLNRLIKSEVRLKLNNRIDEHQ
jgi:hypothetical protein